MIITPYSKNAKKHPAKQIEQIKASLKEFGVQQPIVVDKDGVIIVGHGRYQAIQELGWEMKPEWVKVADLTEDQAKAYRLADNKLNESEWDMDLVMEDLKDLEDDLVELTGFDKDLLIEPDEADDEVPEVPEEPQSKLGDLYELGGHRVLCGDSTKLEDVEQLMDGKKADMVFTDPPFPNNSGIMHEMIVGIEDAFNNARTFCNHTMIWFWDNLQTAPFLEKINARHIWHKTNGWQAGHFEMMNEYRGNEERGECKVYSFPNVGVLKRKEVGGHLTPKPTALPVEILLEKTKENHLVLDIFLGAGSTLIAAEKTGRICYGMELDPKYIDVIVQRYVDYTGNATIKKNGEEIVWKKTPTKSPTNA